MSPGILRRRARVRIRIWNLPREALSGHRALRWRWSTAGLWHPDRQSAIALSVMNESCAGHIVSARRRGSSANHVAGQLYGHRTPSGHYAIALCSLRTHYARASHRTMMLRTRARLRRFISLSDWSVTVLRKTSDNKHEMHTSILKQDTFLVSRQQIPKTDDEHAPSSSRPCAGAFANATLRHGLTGVTLAAHRKRPHNIVSGEER